MIILIRFYLLINTFTYRKKRTTYSTPALLVNAVSFAKKEVAPAKWKLMPEFKSSTVC